jgi:5-methylcytosine-specific restriction endonuclease McrA
MRIYKQGDIREDGFIFDHYDLKVVLSNGKVKEHWRSPVNFKKREKDRTKRKKIFTIKVIKWLDNKKLRKGCQHCGYKKHAIALQFHHIDPSTKENSISEMHKNTLPRFKKIVKEIWKCIILCANCHLIEEKKIRERNG